MNLQNDALGVVRHGRRAVQGRESELRAIGDLHERTGDGRVPERAYCEGETVPVCGRHRITPHRTEQWARESECGETVGVQSLANVVETGDCEAHVTTCITLVVCPAGLVSRTPTRTAIVERLHIR